MAIHSLLPTNNMDEKIKSEITDAAKAIHENSKPHISLEDITSILCTGAQIGIHIAQQVLR